ncbi:MAG TPA: ArgE/DapE family deacylase [Pseudonocardiaceae bacterium]|nr:ArgE/DapE family deacylase [Pseudonocardiaceae bacterium]
MNWDDVDRAVADGAEDAFELLERLVAQPSTVGNEAGAQEVLAEALTDLGCTITRLPIPDGIADHPAAGLQQRPYTNRYDLIGQRGHAPGPSLLINGHIDVVPADDTSRWTHPPFQPVRADGWLRGRGSGDMKAGFVAGILAIKALDAVGWHQNGRLTIVSAIEEECTGNGTLAAGLAGYTADAALLLEPTDLDILLGGVGIIWLNIEVEGRAAHAHVAASVVNPVLAAQPVLDALRDVERELNDHNTDPAFAALTHPYTINVGTFHSGDWSSSVPAVARLGVRVGHPRDWTADDALDKVRDVVGKACANDPWLAEHPPRIELSGYRVQGHALPPDAPLAEQLAQAHRAAHHSEPARITLGSTTDARYYLNQFDMPAVAYGPTTRNIHGTDEAVELASIVATARTVARFLAGYYA